MGRAQSTRLRGTVGILALCLLAAGPARAKAVAEPMELKAESSLVLLGTDVTRPRFSWLAPNGSRGEQDAYQIQVATSAARLASGDLLWDSGKTRSMAQSQVAYAGAELTSRAAYFWRVRVQFKGGQWSAWSSIATWEMGLLKPADWTAKWISAVSQPTHVWDDASIRWTFSASGEPVEFLFRARPVGKTYGEAYAWRLEVVRGRPVIAAISRTYNAKETPLVAERLIKRIPLKLTQAALTARLHELRIDTEGARITTWFDGQRVDTIQDLTHQRGTVGIFQAKPISTLATPQRSDVITLRSLSAVPVGGPGTHTDFSRNDNPLSGGNVEADGLHVADAQGVDIVFPVAGPAPLLRKSFQVEGRVTQARLYVAAGGFPGVEINGLRVNEAIADGFTAYDRRVLYRTIDVTKSLRPGANAIGVELGRGWYDLSEANEWYWHEAPWRAARSLRLQLELTYADGRHQIVASDGSWRVHPGPTLHDSIYAGERYDMRQRPADWSTAKLDDRAWARASVVSGPAGKLDAAEQEPIAVTEVVPPVSLREVRPGVWVYDFGRIFAGRLRLDVDGPAGQTISLVQHEKLYPDGTVLSTSGLVDTQIQTDRVTLAGERLSWSPRFGYRGFRYVEMRGFPGTPTLRNLTGGVMHSDVASIGHFESSDALLNAIQAAARASLLNNMHGFQTDTPTFEKNGWTGDAQASSLAAALNFDVAHVWTKWMADFRDAQAPNGEIPEIVPSTPQYGYENTPGWSVINGPTPSWDAAAFILPNELYQQTGDTRLLADMYDTQKRLVDYTASWFTPGDVRYQQLANTMLGEYATPHPRPAQAASADQTIADLPKVKTKPEPDEVDSVAGAYFYFMTDRLARNAAILGREEDAKSYHKRAEDIRKAYNRNYWDEESGSYRLPTVNGQVPAFTQYMNILPVAFGLVPAGKAPAVIQKVNDDIVMNGYHLSTTGVFAGRYVLDLLSDYGHVDTAYRVVSQTSEPSWGFWIKNDIHTMLEGWELDSRSYDHHYWASVSSWFYRSLAGIRPYGPGYAGIVIKPMTPAGLDHASAYVDTVRGRISSAWRRDGNRLILAVTVPAGTKATVICPANADHAQSGGHASTHAHQLDGGDHQLACSL